MMVRGCVMMDQGRGLDTIMRGIANADSQGSSCCGLDSSCALDCRTGGQG